MLKFGKIIIIPPALRYMDFRHEVVILGLEIGDKEVSLELDGAEAVAAREWFDGLDKPKDVGLGMAVGSEIVS